MKYLLLISLLISGSFAIVFKSEDTNKVLLSKTHHLSLFKKDKRVIKDKIYNKQKFIGKDFKNYTFSNVIFSECNFKNSSFRNSKFDHCVFKNCQIQSIDMRISIIKYTKFKKCEIKRSLFDGSRFYFVDFIYSRLPMSSFRGSNLYKCSFIKTDLSSAIWINGRRCKKGSIGKCVFLKKKTKKLYLRF